MNAKDDAKQCPWCNRWCLKDNACNYIFACGLQDNGVFLNGAGCGRSWCWLCGKKFCTQHYSETGQKLNNKTDHNAECCKKELNFKQEDYCCGGHNSHCEKRW